MYIFRFCKLGSGAYLPHARDSFFCLSSRYLAQTSNKSLLSKLRKTTGYTFSACKEALLKNGNDFEKAKVWLAEEAVRSGWDKAERLAGRSQSQGLLGLLATRSRAVIAEVNCETDFVARTDSFQNFVAIVTETVMNQFTELEFKKSWDSAFLDGLVSTNFSKLGDAKALAIGSVGENITIRRAVGMSVPNQCTSCLASYSHVSTEGVKQSIRDVHFGKYAAIIRYRPFEAKPSTDAWHERAARLGRQVCQHIVGMNPKPHLDLTDPPAADPEEEKCLLWQPFLLDETIQVGEHLRLNEMILEDFVRIECGEIESNQ